MTSKEVTTLEGLQTELNEIQAGEDYCELADTLKCKSSLVLNNLLHNFDQLGEDELSAIQHLVFEIQEGISRMGNYCGKAQDYQYYLNNPDILIETQRIEAITTPA